MTTSSQQLDYSITSSDTITIDLSGFIAQDISTISDTITITNTGMPSMNSVYIDSSTLGTVSTVTDSDWTFNWGSEEWIDSFPAWDRIQNMCEEYPGLKIAFEKFKTTYKLVKDDYDTPKDKRKTP
jgi:hypothetical protein